MRTFRPPTYTPPHKIAGFAFLGLAIAISLLVAVPVVADYIGPLNRTTTTYSLQRQNCFYTANGTYGGSSWGCHLNYYMAPGGSCPSAASRKGYFSASQCEWPVSCSTMGINCTVSGPSISQEGCSSGQTGCTSVANPTFAFRRTIPRNPHLEGSFQVRKAGVLHE
ncbi:MAG: hypothetical protein EHM12_12045 [Dehalococcoidia bacterium]|nr:MAG: hypothetical protein EHM12_12045 [Dehalococcoidia bacterium]